LKEQILHLDPHDDFISARDKMGWVQTQRVLLIWPEHGRRILARRLDLVLLHRHARRLGARMAVISRDTVVCEEARALGLPVFGSLTESRKASWRSRVPAPPKRLHPRPEAKPNLPPKEWPLWLKIVAGVAKGLIFGLGLAALAALAWAIVPSATLTLTPATHPIQTSVEIIADPLLAGGGHSLSASALITAVIPARTVVGEVEDTARIPTTGLTAVPSSPAAGTVVFTNLIGARIAIPQGTGVRTTTGVSVRFVTNSAVTIEGRLGAAVEVGISAEKPGPAGNVAASQINAIDGPLGLQLAVTNPLATRGGAMTQRAAVTAEDRVRLRAQLLDQLQAKAVNAIQTQLQPGEFLVPGSITVTEVVAEGYNLQVGEQADTLELNLRIAVQGLAVSESEARAVGQRALEAQTPPHESLLAGRSTFERDPAMTLDDQGRVHFTFRAASTAVAHIDAEGLRQAVRGKTLGDALLYLAATQPLDETPQVEMWPAWYAKWYPHLPWVAFRIKVIIPAAG
jgi:hypothetical protein